MFRPSLRAGQEGEQALCTRVEGGAPTGFFLEGFSLFQQGFRLGEGFG